ncbi:MAG: hypothetical protein NC123_20240 [Butyrivibrio sp.]|nr:hypothetical protein [Butyrivibrio sp.]
MDTKQFFKKIFNRYTSIGLCLMGFYNVALLVLYFTHRIPAMPDNFKLVRVDISLVLGLTLFGLVLEAILYIRHKGSRPDDAEKR